MPTDIVNILGVNVHALPIHKLHIEIENFIIQNDKALVLNVNVNCLNLISKNPWLHNFLNSAEIVFCDGAGVILGAKILGSVIPERITYADWLWQLAEFAELKDFTFFFLGAHPGIAEKAATRLRAHFPSLKVVGFHHGYFDKTLDSPENEALIRKINEANPNILVLGFGMPLQEKWLMENWKNIDANIALTGGAVFDYISGNLRRAPTWMTNNGFEWLGRLLIEPRRLWRRYLIGNPLFLWKVFKQRLGLF